jgi:hypothetical protein
LVVTVDKSHDCIQLSVKNQSVASVASVVYGERTIVSLSSATLTRVPTGPLAVMGENPNLLLTLPWPIAELERGSRRRWHSTPRPIWQA